MRSDSNPRKLTAADVLARYNDESWPAFCDPLTDVNQVGTFGDRPLHLASYHGDLEVIEALIEGGADVNATGEMGSTPLHNAIEGRHAAAVKFLLEHGAQTDIKDEFGRTAPDVADLHWNADIIALVKGRNEPTS
jgi:ankyrin repeat protein